LGRLRVPPSARRYGLEASAWASCRVKPATPGLLPRFMSASSTSGADADAAALRSLLHVSDEVAEAIASDKPVVALESTIYTHGFMGKGLAREHVDLVRRHGGVPAIIAIVDGVPKVGVSPEEVVRMIEDEGTVKVSRRDVAYLVGMV
jgi:pseudouridylate synthase / pseudouridine kinase